MLDTLRRRWLGRAFKGSPFAPLFEPPPAEEWVALDLETTSLDPTKAEIVAIGAVRIRGARLLTGQALSLRLRPPTSLAGDSIVIHGLRHQDLTDGLSQEQALSRLLAFIGPSPLVGYHIDYDFRILSRHCHRLWGLTLPHRTIEVSRLYYDAVTRHLPGSHLDLRLSSICQHLALPRLEAHDALNDALTAALIFVRLRFGPAPGYPKV
ncbi:3'-5' exonuclease [Aeromonas diversa]|uniref:DNA polymerase III subunit epsilon n=1 Tax=Aeromonas diversa CDC 2478-85 TaxID=1268237 RepID=N9TZS1_9GAMM|nr:3'-5' exonuclease [Aeromonas diversa]ENY71565.1 DNA polymerase III subunit epsilon [Aeromonas diversa CDC 2478-85]